MQPLSLAPLQSWGGNNSPEFAFLSLLLTLCPGWSLILAGLEVPVNQAAGTSRGAESWRARPTTCPGSPGKVGEVQAPPGVPEWLREVVGRGWGGPLLLFCAGLSAQDLGQGLSAGSLWAGDGYFVGPKGSSSRSSHLCHDCSRRRNPVGDRRGEWGGRVLQHSRTALWLVREETCCFLGSLIKTYQ